MQQSLAILALIVVGSAAIAEIDIVAPFVAGNLDEPGWRRTSQGWVKVGALGDAAFARPNRTPVTRGALHPLLLTVFVTLASLAALISHSGASEMDLSASGDGASSRNRLRPHFRRKVVVR